MAENLHIPITGDNKNFLNALHGAQEGVRQTAQQIEQSGMSIEQMFGRTQKAAVASLAGFSAKEFIQKVVSIRGEFQQLEVAFNTMLGSAEKANTLMQQLTKTASVTPFDLKGVTDGAKQLLAYGVQAEEVNETLVRLGDIAAGLSLPLGDLVYLYGTTLTQGRMYIQDLRQFMGRGIPLAEELAKQFGVTKDKVQELVSTGKVGAEEFKKAIISMSSEGGKFGGLMEEQSKTITGQISNIEDAIDVMFNNIGKQNEGIINGSLSVVSSLVENYERVGKVIAGVVATYGVYKAAVMTATAMQSLQTAATGALTAAEIAHHGWLVLCEKAQKPLNATMLANPYVLVATAVAGLVAVMVTMKTQQELVNEATEEYNRKKEEAIAKEEEHRNKLDELIRIAGDESLSTDTRREAMLKLKAEYPDLFTKYNTEIEALKDIAYWKAKIAEIESGKSIKLAKNELEDVNKQIAELEERAKANYEAYQKLAPSERRYASPSLTREETAKLIQLKNRRQELTNEMRKEEVSNYFKDLTGVSNEELERQLNVRRSLLAKIRMAEQEGKKDVKGTVKTGGATGTFSKDELQDQVTSLEWEINRRAETRLTPSQQKAQLYKDLQAARKALADFDKSSDKYTKDEAEKARKKLQDAVDAAEKAYKAFGGSVSKGKTAEQQKQQREREARAQEQYEETLRKQKLAEKRAAEDMEIETRQAIIDAQEESTDKVIAQYQLDFDREKLAIERGYEDLKQKKIDDARTLFHADPANKGKTFDESSVNTDYTEEETNNYTQSLEANDKKLKRRLRELQEEDKRYQLEYLKEYGSYQEQKLAIAAEYDERIAKESNEWAKKSLEEQKKQALDEVEMMRVKFSIDWGAVFGNLASRTTKELEVIKRNLESLSRSGNFEDIEQIKELQSAISALGEELASRKGGFVALKDAYHELREATKDVITAEENLNRARAEGNAESIRTAERELLLARERKNTSESSLDAAKKATAKFIETITNIDFSSFSNVFLGIKDLAPTIDAAFKTNLSGIFQGMGDEMTNALAQLGDSIVSATKTIIDVFHVDDTRIQEQLTAYDMLKDSIDALSDKMENGSFIEALETYNTQLQLLEEQTGLASGTLSEAMALYQSKCIGWGNNHHSVNAYLDDRLTGKDFEAINSLLGTTDINSASQLWGLTPEQLNEIKTYLPNVWAQIKNAADDVKAHTDDSEDGEKAWDALMNYIGLAGQKDEIEKNISIRLTGLSLENLKSEFRSALDDIKHDADDFAEDISKTLSNALLNMRLAESGGANDRLETWYQKLRDLIADRANISEEEFANRLNVLRQEYADISQEGMEARDWANKMAGYSPEDAYEQNPSVGAWQSMGEDTGQELNGRFTALQIAGENISECATAMLATLNAISSVMGEDSTTLIEIRNLMITNNAFLEDILEVSRGIGKDLHKELKEIIKNTK